MKKFWLTLTLILSLIVQSADAQFMIDKSNRSGNRFSIKVTSFPDYFPFAVLKEPTARQPLVTIFDKGLKEFAQQGNFEIKYLTFEDYPSAVSGVRRGKADLLLGAYYATKLYSGLEYIYPAALHNPIHVIMLPKNISKVEKVEDLKNLKGIYIESEHFSDYMLKNFENFNIKPVKTPYEAYEKLFVGDVDFVIGSYYYNYAYTLQTGLNNYVAFSKAALWNMPLFLTISKASPISKQLRTSLTQFINTDVFKQSISDELQNKMHELEEKSRGVVPPKFVRVESFNELTPADEPVQRQTEEQTEE